MDTVGIDRTLEQHTGADQRQVGAIASAAWIRIVWTAVATTGRLGRSVR